MFYYTHCFHKQQADYWKTGAKIEIFKQTYLLIFCTYIGSDINLLPLLKKCVDDPNMAILRSSVDASCTILEQCQSEGCMKCSQLLWMSLPANAAIIQLPYLACVNTLPSWITSSHILHAHWVMQCAWVCCHLWYVRRLMPCTCQPKVQLLLHVHFLLPNA